MSASRKREWTVPGIGPRGFPKRHDGAEREGFEPSDPVSQVNSLAVSPIRPLSHLSDGPAYATCSGGSPESTQLHPYRNSAPRHPGQPINVSTKDDIAVWSIDNLAVALSLRRLRANPCTPEHPPQVDYLLLVEIATSRASNVSV